MKIYTFKTNNYVKRYTCKTNNLRYKKISLSFWPKINEKDKSKRESKDKTAWLKNQRLKVSKS